MAVSYTHLDVYKRQVYARPFGMVARVRFTFRTYGSGGPAAYGVKTMRLHENKSMTVCGVASMVNNKAPAPLTS